MTSLLRSRSSVSGPAGHSSPSLGGFYRDKDDLRTATTRFHLLPHRRKYVYLLLASLLLGGYLYSGRHASYSIPRTSPVEQKYAFEESSGLLYFPLVNASIEHPIVHLIRRGKREWQDKLDRQSKSLSEAVNEYKRRYSRDPPKGFDLWYQFAVENGVKLIDEYDQIDRDITPFLGYPSSVLKERSQTLIEDQKNYWRSGSYTLVVRDGQLQPTIGPMATAGRAEEQASLMTRFVQYLPDLNITTWLHDTPILHTSGDLKAKLITAARQRTFIHPSLHSDVHDTPDHIGWEAFCLPDAPLRNYMSGLTPLTQPKSFISSHVEGMDICLHPLYLPLHSLTGNYGLGPTPVPFWPLFSHSKMNLYSDLLITPLEQYESLVGPDPDWGEKSMDKLLWRGSTTGSRYDRRTLWKLSQRGRLNTVTNTAIGTTQIMLADADDKMQVVERSMADLNSAYFDVAFAGQPIQCENDGTCDAVKRTYRFSDRQMGQEEANMYKYVIDVDGNGWSGRFHRLLASKSAVLKSTGFVEWYQERIQPWVHYVPVKIDYADIHDIMAFFLGDVNGDNAHDNLGEEIGLAGQRWTEEHWRLEDMELYMFRLYLEYARAILREEDGTGMDYLG